MVSDTLTEADDHMPITEGAFSPIGDVHGVTLGCVNGEPEIEIGQHIFVRSKATWEVMPEGVETLEEGPSSS